MPAEPNVLHSIDLRSVFPFIQIFRAFRVAMQPSKLVLALVALLLIYVGGRVLDRIFPAAYPGEARLYASSFLSFRANSDFRDSVKQAREATNEQYNELFTRMYRLANPDATNPPPESFNKEIGQQIAKERQKAVDAASRQFTKDDEKVQLNSAIESIYAQAAQQMKLVELRHGRGPFAEFMEFEADRVNAAALSVITFKFVEFDPEGRPGGGLLGALFDIVVVGPSWLLSQHPWFAILLAWWGLLMVAIFGGAISRIAAVEVAREEKISIRNALRFSFAKLVSYVSAPIMPLLVVIGIALLLAIAGWLSELAFIGGTLTVVIGIAFCVAIFLAVLAGLALIGVVGGFGLMYPTISVEGSDSFDAVSRAFSYVFARPWRVFFYSLVAVIHGALTYLFLRFFVWVTLLLAHTFLLLWTGPRHAGDTSLRHIFPTPQFSELHPAVSGFNLTGTEYVASGVLSFWAYLFITLLGAYLLSWYLSANTIIYYLLRQEIDAAELDEVYLEPSDEEFDDLDEPAPETKVEPAAAAAAPAPTPDAPPQT
ncbi:MAG: hypothetical protein QM770_08150 [Tepidisphaeraceae bacterium]